MRLNRSRFRARLADGRVVPPRVEMAPFKSFMFPPSLRRNSLIIQLPALHNYGTGMMGINLIHHLHALAPRTFCSFAADFETAADIAALQAELGNSASDVRLSAADPLALQRKLALSTRLRRLDGVPLLRRLLDWLPCLQCARYAQIFFLGGDALWEGYYAEDRPIPLLEFLARAEKYAPLYLLGQTIAPFRNKENVHLLQNLRRTHIYTRDQRGYDYLAEEAGIDHARLHRSSDLALLPLPRQNDASLWAEVAERYGLNPGRYVTVVMSGLSSHYAENDAHFQHGWRAIVDMLLNLPELADQKLCLLVHVCSTYGGKPEKELVRDVYASFSPEQQQRLIPIVEEILPTRARQVLAHGRLVITARMHASVSAYQAGIPALALSYSPKYEALIGEGLQCGDLVLPAAGDELWKSGSIAGLVREKTLMMLSQYEELGDRIRRNVLREQQLVRQSLEEIASLSRD